MRVGLSGAIMFALITPVTICGVLGAEAGGICSLLTTAEVAAALNEKIQPAQSRGPDGCLWQGTGTDSVMVQAPGTGRPGFDNAKSRMSPTVAVSGVGDAAFAFVSVAGFVEIDLVKADKYYTVLVQTQGGKGAQAAAEGLAAKVASRL
jgi:hypothetical protein